MKTMKFDKTILILMGSLLSVLYTFSTTAQAAEKQSGNKQGINAIWSSLGVSNTSQTNIEDAKLARQRAIWRAKWEAEQRAKGKLPKRNNVIAKAVSKPPKARIPARQQVAGATRKAAPPKPLTRAQYQWRFKQAQLKKQQQQKRVSRQPSPIKPSHAVFRQNRNAAIYNRLPADIVAKLRRTGVRENGVSVYVQDVNSPKPLLAYQDTTARVPASVMKLITSYAALGILGPNYRWPLDVFSQGKIKNGTLQGDLIIKGYGSPEFKTADLRKVLKGIRQKGIRNISGRVVFDNSYFNAPRQSAGSFDGRSLSHYNAKPDALLFNERLSSFHVSARGKRVKVTTSTPAANLKIVNRIRKTRRGCRPRMRVTHRGSQTIVTFSGRFSRRCGTRTYTKVVSAPANMIFGAMRTYWKRDVGGNFNARFAMGRVPTGARPLLRTYSRTLAQILPTIDKDSNNVMARQLLLTIGAKHSGGTGTERNGANAIGTWLASRGLHFPELRIENGSGLSRTARISARHLGDLMIDAYRSPYRQYLMRSLAVAGVDGTMKRRLKGTRVRGRGFFKTGTLRDVRSIAGYVKAANGKTYVMAILHNDPRARRRSLVAHDKLIEWVFDGGGKPHYAMR